MTLLAKVRWPGAGVQGHIDTLDEGILFGWAWFRNQPQSRPLIDIYVDDLFLGQCIANLYRQDLKDEGLGDGCYGFSFDIRPFDRTAKPENFNAYVAGSKQLLLPSVLKPIARQKIARRSLSPEGYLAKTFRGFLEAAPQQVDALPINKGAPTPLYERLLVPASATEPDSNYLAYVRRRYQGGLDFYPQVAEAQRLALLKWYLDGYLRRRGRMRAPLCANDINFLNDLSAGGMSRARMLYASRFAAHRFSFPSVVLTRYGLDLEIEDLESDGACFDWCAFHSAHLFAEDSLVNATDHNSMAALLPESADLEFPLSVFMEFYRGRNRLLSAAPIETADQRAFFYSAFMLFAAAAPHFLLYAPKDWVEKMLLPQGDGKSPFARICARLFPTIEMPEKKWCNRLEENNFDLNTFRFKTRTASGGRLYAAALTPPETETVDIQLIGPFTRALGVADSCRRIAHALQHTNYSLRFCDFKLDHPNAEGTAEDLKLGALGPARVNIIHLNLEELPKAIAYYPDIFSNAWNIAMPYLETTPLGPVQRLGLSLVDEVWAASTFIENTIAPFSSVTKIGAAGADFKPLGRLIARAKSYSQFADPDDFIFLTAGDALSGVYRKNILGVVRTFQTAFPLDKGVRLVIKTHSLGKLASSHELAVWRAIQDSSLEDRRIHILDKLLEKADYDALIEGADCFVSLHRAEGLGFHALEALQLGVSVIASDYSGTQDFCTAETAFLVPVQLTHIDRRYYPLANPEQVWAEPDLMAAAKAMRQVFSDIPLRDYKADMGKKLTQQSFSLKFLSQAVNARLSQLLPAQRGENI